MLRRLNLPGLVILLAYGIIEASLKLISAIRGVKIAYIDNTQLEASTPLERLLSVGLALCLVWGVIAVIQAILQKRV